MLVKLVNFWGIPLLLPLLRAVVVIVGVLGEGLVVGGVGKREVRKAVLFSSKVLAITSSLLLFLYLILGIRVRVWGLV